MKLKLGLIGRDQTIQPIDIGRWNNGINLMIMAHILIFVVYTAATSTGLFEVQVGELTIGDYVQRYLTLTGGEDQTLAGWVSGIAAYQFIHINPWELLVSMSTLWFFGHMLRSRLDEQKVLSLYLVTILVAAIAFVLSYYVFQVFTGRSTVMAGAFSGALGVATAATFLNRTHSIRVGRRMIPLWRIYVWGVLLPTALILKPSIAYVIVYIISIWVGGRYGQLMSNKLAPATMRINNSI